MCQFAEHDMRGRHERHTTLCREARQAREEASLTQEEVARRLHTNRSTISRIENHAGEVRLSALRRYAEAVGADLQINFVRG